MGCLRSSVCDLCAMSVLWMALRDMLNVMDYNPKLCQSQIRLKYKSE